MKCYCPKCGHETEVSAADIRRQKGMVVCPKCLTTFKMPLPASSVQADDDDDDTPPPIPPRRRATPKAPAHAASGTGTRRATAAANSAPAARPRQRTARPRQAPARRKPAPAPTPSKPVTKGGCALISIGVTVGFFLLYMLIGLLFDRL